MRHETRDRLRLHRRRWGRREHPHGCEQRGRLGSPNHEDAVHCLCNSWRIGGCSQLTDGCGRTKLARSVSAASRTAHASVWSLTMPMLCMKA